MVLGVALLAAREAAPAEGPGPGGRRRAHAVQARDDGAAPRRASDEACEVRAAARALGRRRRLREPRARHPARAVRSRRRGARCVRRGLGARDLAARGARRRRPHLTAGEMVGDGAALVGGQGGVEYVRGRKAAQG